MNRIIFDIQHFADIYNDTSNTIVTGTADADSISNHGSSVTINAGEGNDSIENFNYTINEGNDTLYYGGNYSSINGGEGNDFIENGGSYAIISAENGDDTIYNHFADNVTLIGGTGNDEFGNSGNNVLIIGNEGDDSIHNDGSNVIINVGDGDDSIRNYSSFVTIDGGVGDDYVKNYGSNVTINGGAGNDSISTRGSNVTVIAGDGDDYISSNRNDYDDTEVFVYSSGNDTIQSFQSGEILCFAATYTDWTTAPSKYYYNYTAKDLIINAAEGSVRIRDAKNKLVELADANGNVITHAYLASGYEGALDYRNDNIFDVLVGADNLSNQIYAGTGGSSMWGGNGGNDELHGNSGYDEFVYKYGDGNDTIFNAGAEDVVNITSILPEQIAGAEITDNGVNAQFTDGGSLNINGQAGAFILGGQRFGADYQSKTWYVK